ncbi:MAG: bifunctional proline dehydrogenase/L-glutamate gamma-semialdehyde dehydrogenase PutA [Pseudomonadota bacterium]|nr:bifunctional proline dehydrogenase/L-glutamate gamma-semialdehyde dehydrogenase PutA [Pseudomonadota bacterium]
MQYTRLDITETEAYQPLLEAYRVDEASHVKRLCSQLQWSQATLDEVQQRARDLVTTVRANRRNGSGVDALMQEYQLSSDEGVVLMCLAEALLRIPDVDTADRLIEDKLASGNWGSHLGRSDSLFVNASTWGLMLSGRIMAPLNTEQGQQVFRQFAQRCGEPMVRQAVRQAMRIMARHFVMGRTIDEALKRRDTDYRYSFDMLGEAAGTQPDSQRYFKAYAASIHAIGKTLAERSGPIEAPGISIKLSALHPRFELSQADRVMAELIPKARELALLARRYDIGLTVDAEEADRLDLTLAVFAALAHDPALSGWDGLGLAVQAYQKRCFDLLDWLAELARSSQRRLMVRLVKGAYWDSEIKRAQERGLSGYPVFTRKVCTDVSYLACAQKLLNYHELLYPQFATHNAYTVAAILTLAGDYRDFEFQRLHGMGGPLYDQLLATSRDLVCRVYAPVGSHEDLLPYLVRRLLENGANTSFVNRILDDQAPVESLIQHPHLQIAGLEKISHPRIPLPVELYPDRVNSAGIDLHDTETLAALQGDWKRELQRINSAQHSPSSDADIERALATAHASFEDWDATEVEQRARCLENLAQLLEVETPRLMALCTTEGGKTITDGVAEVREAVDFCRYYALQARREFTVRTLPGPTGELNQWRLRGKGVFVCISPWNFPLAIFLGQVTAALVAGNSVVAKPAEQTPAVAIAAAELIHQAGIPKEVFQLVLGGEKTGRRLVRDSRVAGVAFTGSTAAARSINQSLAARDAPIATLIAETGGLNAMIVDSSALLEQVVTDVLQSGFQSAGQRCSALRILLVQEDIADELIRLLAGAMDELCIGDPARLATDVGPVIDAEAYERLAQHTDFLDSNARCRKRCALPEELPSTLYFPPQLYEITSIDQIQEEVFGPIVHLLRYHSADLDKRIDEINATGYGLTFGIHSRIDSRARQIASRIRAGNVYVNRNMIGAIVGVQPFGGTGLSGTGPKAGGPHYLSRFATEQSISTNTTAAGGNASLMAMSDDDS